MADKPMITPVSGIGWTPSSDPPGGALEPIDSLQRGLLHALKEAKRIPDFARVRTQIDALAEAGDDADELALRDLCTDAVFGAEALERALNSDPDLPEAASGSADDLYAVRPTEGGNF